MSTGSMWRFEAELCDPQTNEPIGLTASDEDLESLASEARTMWARELAGYKTVEVRVYAEGKFWEIWRWEQDGRNDNL